MPTKQKIRNIIGWLILALVVLIVGFRLSLTPLIESGINGWFEQQGIESEIRDLTIDLSDAAVSLSGLNASVDGSPVLKLDEFKLKWSWSALFDNQLKLKAVAIAGVTFDIDHGTGHGLKIAGVDLAKLAADSESSESQSDQASEPLDWSLSLQQLEIENLEVCYRALPLHDYCNRFDQFSWEGQLFLDLAQSDATSPPVEAAGDIRLTNAQIHNNRLDRSLLGLDQISLREIRIDSLDQIEIVSVTLDALELFERSADSEPKQMVQLKTLQLTEFRLTQLAQLKIALVELQDHQLILVNQKDNQFEIDEWLASESDTGDKTEAPDQPFTFAIEKLTYQTDKSIRYQDNSLDKPFVVDLHSIDVEINNLDSINPAQASDISISLKYGEHGSIELGGSATPLDSKPSFNLTGRIEGLDLRDLSPFTTDAIGHTIKSGQLDSDLTLVADNSVLDSKAVLTLNQFQLEPLSEADKERIDSSIGFPLNTSLSLLRDRDNKIELEIPITGDLQSPDFDPNDAITQATSSAITAAVLNYYTPFGLVTLVDGLFSLAIALDFEPLVFPSANSDVDRVDRGGLDQIAVLMRDRPGVHVTLCAFTNSADRKLLLPDTADTAADELELNTEQSAVLLELGEQRATAIKNYLVEKQIEPARLVLCASEHKEGEGLAGVEISI